MNIDTPAFSLARSSMHHERPYARCAPASRIDVAFPALQFGAIR